MFGSNLTGRYQVVAAVYVERTTRLPRWQKPKCLMRRWCKKRSKGKLVRALLEGF